MRLAELASKYGADKLDHGYCPRYEDHVAPRLLWPRNVLEVGVAGGASMRVWADWWTTAHVCGVDIMDVPAVDHPRVEVIRGDVKSTPRLEGRWWDVVIDDGSHNSDDIRAAFGRLWPRVRPGGWYVVEDLFTQWQANYGGSEHGSPAIWLLAAQLAEVVRGSGEAAELHAYEKIVFLHKHV